VKLLFFEALREILLIREAFVKLSRREFCKGMTGPHEMFPDIEAKMTFGDISVRFLAVSGFEGRIP
jgi:hypothetical protein